MNEGAFNENSMYESVPQTPRNEQQLMAQKFVAGLYTEKLSGITDELNKRR
jgi:hypothetical protein